MCFEHGASPNFLNTWEILSIINNFFTYIKKVCIELEFIYVVTAHAPFWGQHPEERYPRDEDSIEMTSTTSRTSEPARRLRALSLSIHTHTSRTPPAVLNIKMLKV